MRVELRRERTVTEAGEPDEFEAVKRVMNLTGRRRFKLVQ